MKRCTITTLIAALLGSTGITRAESNPPSTPLAPPEAVFEHADLIGLSAAQRDHIRKIMEAAQDEIASGTQELEAANGELSAELSQAPVDSAQALAKFDQVLELERTMKHLHLKTLIAINNTLEPGQRENLLSKGLAGEMREPAAVTEQRLKGKVERLSGFAQTLAAAGTSPDHIHEMMKTFTGFMEQGKTSEAEALIDQTLAQLRGAGAGVPDGAAIDPDELRKEVDAMQVEEVAWRKIAWRTCLIDGVKASREQKKPLILWVFIDRPVDDKRC